MAISAQNKFACLLSVTKRNWCAVIAALECCHQFCLIWKAHTVNSKKICFSTDIFSLWALVAQFWAAFVKFVSCFGKKDNIAFYCAILIWMLAIFKDVRMFHFVIFVILTCSLHKSMQTKGKKRIGQNSRSVKEGESRTFCRGQQLYAWHTHTHTQAVAALSELSTKRISEVLWAAEAPRGSWCKETPPAAVTHTQRGVKLSMTATGAIETAFCFLQHKLGREFSSTLPRNYWVTVFAQ